MRGAQVCSTGSRRVFRCYFDCNVRNISAQIHRETLDCGKEGPLDAKNIMSCIKYTNLFNVLPYLSKPL